MVLGVILGPIAEKNLDRALQLSRNDWTIIDNMRKAKAQENA